MIDWQEIDNTVKEFSLSGKERIGKVVDVYDGDSVKIVFSLFETDPLDYRYVLYKWTCRLNNIDTPEIKTKKTSEKELGIKVRDILREKILNKMVKIKCHKFDKYGRLLVEIYLHDLCINDWLIENNYAKCYHGGKKTTWI